MWVAASYRGEARGLSINASPWENSLVKFSLKWISNLEGIFTLWQCGLSAASEENLCYLTPGTSGLPVPRWYVNKAPQSLAHCHASVVWRAAMGNNTPCRAPGANPGPSVWQACELTTRPWELHRREAWLFFTVIHHTGKKSQILTRIWAFVDCNSVWIHRWLWNDAQSLMLYRRGAPFFFKVMHHISRSHRPKNWWFE